MPLSRDAQSHAPVHGVLDYGLQLRQIPRFEIVGLPIDRMVDEIPTPVVPVRAGPEDRRAHKGNATRGWSSGTKGDGRVARGPSDGYPRGDGHRDWDRRLRYWGRRRQGF